MQGTLIRIQFQSSDNLWSISNRHSCRRVVGLSRVARLCNSFFNTLAVQSYSRLQWFPSLRTVIVLKKLPYPFDQLEARLKPHVTCSLGFSRASNSVLVLPRVLVGLLKFLLSDWTLQLPRCLFDDIQ